MTVFVNVYISNVTSYFTNWLIMPVLLLLQTVCVAVQLNSLQGALQ